MRSPVSVQPIIITQAFKGNVHRGVDIRSVDFVTWRKLPIVATEAMTITGRGIDGYGNDYLVARPDDTNVADTLKYIHCLFYGALHVGMKLREGDELGVTSIAADYNPPRGNSEAHHLHFETWKDGAPIDPLVYFSHGGLNVKDRRSRA